MTLRTAVIGAGIVSENNHLPALDRNPRTDLVAVCDFDCEAVRAAASEYGCVATLDAASGNGTEIEIRIGQTPVMR